MANVKSVSIGSGKILCLTAMIVWMVTASPGRAQPNGDNNTISVNGPEPNRQESGTSDANEPGVRELIVRLMVASVLVAVLGIAVIIVSKKAMPRLSHLPNKRVRMLETLHIGPRKTVHLLEIGDRQLLIGSTASHMVKLAELPSVASAVPQVGPAHEGHRGQG